MERTVNMRARDRYLKRRGNRYYYMRRVPKAVSEQDRRGTIRVALKTGSIEVARTKRDGLEAA